MCNHRITIYIFTASQQYPSGGLSWEPWHRPRQGVTGKHVPRLLRHNLDLKTMSDLPTPGQLMTKPSEVMKFVILLRFLSGVMVFVILVPNYSAIALSWAIMCPTISRLKFQMGNMLTKPNCHTTFPTTTINHRFNNVKKIQVQTSHRYTCLNRSISGVLQHSQNVPLFY